MYGAAAGFAQKWAEARRFYEDDLASGFVRLQAELWAASLSNPGLREKFLPRLLAWKKLVLGAVREAMAALQADGVKLPPPFTPEVIACWISEFWLGMEFADLLGVKEEQAAASRGAGRHAVAARIARRAGRPASRARSAPKEPPMDSARRRVPERFDRIAGPLPEPGAVPRRRRLAVRDRAARARGLRRPRRREDLVRGVGRQRALARLCAAVPDRAQRRCSRPRCPTCRSTSA